MRYKYKAKPIFYSGVQYRSRLEARWAAFFDFINWPYTYEPFDLEKWSPDFKIKTEDGKEFLVEVKPKGLIDNDLKMKLGIASDYSEGILILDESPFTSKEIPNCIGLTSIKGKTKDYRNNDDFEFCSSVVMNPYSSGNGIFNLCLLNEEEYSNNDSTIDFCSLLWKKAGNEVQFLKPV